MFSKLERFPKEKTAIVPPVGAYDPKCPEKSCGPVSFKRSPREKQVKVHGPGVGYYDPKYPDYKIKSIRSFSKLMDSANKSKLSNCSINAKTPFSVQKFDKRRRSKSVDNFSTPINNDLDVTVSMDSLTIDEDYNGRLNALILENERLSNVIKSLKDQLTIAVEEKRSFEALFVSMESEHQEVCTEKERLANLVKRLEEQLAAAIDEKHELESENAVQKSALETLTTVESKCQEMCTENDRLTSLVKNLEVQLAVAINENTLQKRTLEELTEVESRHQEVSVENERLTNLIKCLEDQLTVAINEKLALESENTLQQSTIETLTTVESKHQELCIENERLTNLMKCLEEQLTVAIDEKRKLESEIIFQKSTIETLSTVESKHQEVCVENGRLTDLVNSLEDQLAVAINENTLQKRTIEELTEVESRHQEVSVENERLTNFIKCLEDQLTVAVDEKRALESEITFQRSTIETLTIVESKHQEVCIENGRLTDLMKSLEDKLAVAIDEKRALESENAVQKSALETLTTVESKHQELCIENERLTDFIKCLEDQLTVAIDEKRALESENIVQKDTLETLINVESKRQEVCIENERLTDFVKSLEDQLAVAIDEKRALDSENTVHRHTLDMLTAQQDALEIDRKNFLDLALKFCDENEQLIKDKGELEEQLNSVQKSNEDRLEQILIDVREIKANFGALVESHNALCERVDKLQSKKETEKERLYENAVIENTSLKSEISRLTVELREAMNVLAEKTNLLKCADEENKKYKIRCAQLEEKMEPFKEQLDLYQGERALLEEREHESEETLKELMEKYAALLSHQNQKQKIRHVVKLKDNCMKFRQETLELRKENAKLKVHIDSLQDKLDKVQGKRRFDPTKAFRFVDKENIPLESVH